MLKLRAGRVVQGLAVLWLAEFTCVATGMAQIVPDGTLPVNSTVPGGCTICTIDGGTVQGTNLYHSFSQFSVPTGGEAFFNNAAGIQNILTRVTGGTASSIDGLIRTNGTANLFLLNPNGIRFGANAALQVDGSFFATTANSFVFSDGSTFSAVNPQAPPLLMVTAPIGLQYGAAPAAIQNLGDLRVGGDLTLAGGNLDLQGPLSAGGGLSLQAQDSVTILNTVQIDPGDRIEVLAKGDVVMQGPQAKLTAGTADTRNAGNIFVTARSLSLTDGAQITSKSEGGASGDAGNITLKLQDTLSLDTSGSTPSAIFSIADFGYGGIPNSIGNGGNGGNITIETRDLIVKNGSEILANNFGDRPSSIAGDIEITALGRVVIDGYRTEGSQERSSGIATNIRSSINSPGVNKLAGIITINAASLDVLNGGYISSNLEESTDGSAGYIILDISHQGVPGNVLIRGKTPEGLPSQISTSTQKESFGDSGVILLKAGTVELSNFGQINAETRGKSPVFAPYIELTASNLLIRESGAIVADLYGTGQAGEIRLKVSDRIDLQTEGRIVSVIRPGAQGEGGDIEVNTGTLSIVDGARISVSTLGMGDAGDIEITARDQVTLERAGRISSSVRAGAVGNAGNISISTASLQSTTLGLIETRTAGTGNAGNIVISAIDSISLQQNAQISNTVESTGQGRGGNINLNAPRIFLSSGQIQVDSKATGDNAGAAGKIDIQANRLTLDNKSEVTAQTDSGKGGDIFLDIKNLLLMRRGSLISTSAGSENSPGDGGKLSITARQGFVVASLSENSDIIANAFGGKGGSISIKANKVFGFDLRSKLSPPELKAIRTNGISDISASSDIGADGSIDISALTIDPANGLIELPVDLADASGQITQACGVGGPAKQGGFTITGRGGVHAGASDQQDRGSVPIPWVKRDGVGQSDRATSVAPPKSDAAAPIIEAQGIAVTAKGEISLTANAKVTPHAPRSGVVVCPQARS